MKTQLASAFFAASLAAAGAAESKFGTKTIRVPDGYELELIASSPLVDRPISVSFDEQGRLYATDSSGSNEKGPTQYERKDHRAVRLEDTNGDGKFDKTTVFADKLTFPEGALFHEGSLYIAGPPEIVKLTDANGDGVAEKREVWHDGNTVTGCANDLHGPYLGRDGWIYFTKGAFAEQKWEINGKPFTTRAGHIFRTRPDHSGLEPVMTGGMDNPVGVTFLSTGERILSCTFFQFPAMGKRDGLIHAIYGGVYGKEHDSIYEHTMTGGVMPVLMHMGAAAPAGVIAGSDALFGGGHRDALFASYFNLHKVVRHELIPDGASFKTKETDLVASDDPDFHPTDVLEDADGSLIIVDTGGWYKICCPTSQLAKPDVLGAIYRVRKAGTPKLADPRGLKIAWTKQSPEELAKQLEDPRHFVQQRAIAELGKRGPSAVAALQQVVVGRGVLTAPSSAKSRRAEDSAPYLQTEARINAVWALARIEGNSAREAVRNALSDSDASVAHAAIHGASLWRDNGATSRLITFVTGGNAALARAAAEALGRIGDKHAVPALLEAAGRNRPGAGELALGAPADAPRRILEHSLIFALIEIGDARGTAAGLASPNPQTRRAALVALDQMNSGGLKPGEVTPLLTATDPVLRQTAEWIVSHHADWGAALADSYRARLASPPAGESAHAELAGQLAKLAKSGAIQHLLATTAGGEMAAEARVLAFRAMAGAGLKETPGSWLDALARVLPSAAAPVLAPAVTAARTLSLPKAGHPGFTSALATVGRRADAPVEVRLEALAAAGNLPTVEPELFDFLVAHVAPSKPMTTRGTAAGVLARARLSAPQQLTLAAAMKTVSPLEAPKLLPAFERNASEELGMKLVASLKDSSGLRGLRVDLLKPLLAKYPKAVQEAGQPLLDSLNADAAQQAAHLNALMAQLPPGDLRRGQAVFVSARAACTTCHAQGHLGGRLGPDLTNIGKVRTERDLLEAIVFPSASFVRSYESFIVITRDGDDFNGILQKDAPDEVILATGPQLEQRIARADITDIRPSAVSIMPGGLDAVLTRQELADLVAFLKQAQR
jgi:putative membrane-bound dehydrogenase-like protein